MQSGAAPGACLLIGVGTSLASREADCAQCQRCHSHNSQRSFRRLLHTMQTLRKYGIRGDAACITHQA